MKNKQFEEWMNITPSDLNAWGYVLAKFYELPFSMQWGVYLEFFDSVEIDIDLMKWISSKKQRWDVNIWHNNDSIEYRLHGTREEAQKESIKKAFKILEA